MTAYNSDGQSSQLVQSASPVTWSYGNSAVATVGDISPASLPAGSEASVDITGSGFAFTPGLTTVGFGTTDVVVRQLFVLSPNHLKAGACQFSPHAALANPDVECDLRIPHGDCRCRVPDRRAGCGVCRRRSRLSPMPCLD